MFDYDPLIFNFFFFGINCDIYVLYLSDGKLEIIVPSFVHYLEVLEGSDGDKMPGIACLLFGSRS